MFDRFNHRSRLVLGLARQHALRLNHDYLGTEHILLGLVSEGTGVGSRALRDLGVDLRAVQQEVERLVSKGTVTVADDQLPFTPRAKRVLELSLEEAGDLRHAHIGTEHLLLGLVRETEGIAAQALRNLKVSAEDVRAKVLEILDTHEAEGAS